MRADDGLLAARTGNRSNQFRQRGYAETVDGTELRIASPFRLFPAEHMPAVEVIPDLLPETGAAVVRLLNPKLLRHQYMSRENCPCDSAADITFSACLTIASKRGR
jgi:hypothetical protein